MPPSPRQAARGSFSPWRWRGLNMEFEDDVVLITGAAGVLGTAAAAAFSDAGARVALIDVNDAALAAAYPGTDARRFTAAANLMDAASTAKAVDAIAARFGRIDALCNIAGGFHMGP